MIQVSGYYPPHVGGIEFCVANIARELTRRGLKVAIVTSSIGAAATSAVAGPGEPAVYRLRALEVAHTPLMPGLAWRLWRERDALIHLHVSHVWTDIVTTLVAALTRRPLVSHFHMDTPTSGRLGVIFELYKRYLLGWLLRRAGVVIALSQEQADVVTGRYRVPAERVRVIPNGVADEFFTGQPADGPAADGPAAALRLLFVGRLAAQKELPLLLETVALLGASVTLDIVGDGELGAEISKLAAAVPGGRARMWGALSGADLLERYRQADVFVMTSEREGMPLALLEAMAAGLPVVASDVQGLREVVRDVGLLVGERTPAAFAAQLQLLGEDPALRARLGAASRRAVASRRWDALIDRVLDAYALAGAPLIPGAGPGQPGAGQQEQSSNQAHDISDQPGRRHPSKT